MLGKRFPIESCLVPVLSRTPHDPIGNLGNRLDVREFLGNLRALHDFSRLHDYGSFERKSFDLFSSERIQDAISKRVVSSRVYGKRKHESVVPSREFPVRRYSVFFRYETQVRRLVLYRDVVFQLDASRIFVRFEEYVESTLLFPGFVKRSAVEPNRLAIFRSADKLRFQTESRGSEELRNHLGLS